MERKNPLPPLYKKFYKISELAGKRWQNITADDIYNWHDLDIKISVKSFSRLIHLSEGNEWLRTPHYGEINLFSYWIFFPVFRAIKERKEIEQRTDGISPYTLLSNTFLLVDTAESAGFAYNNYGFVECLTFYDTKGKLCLPAEYKKEAEKAFIWTVKINKEDILISSDTVQIIEKIQPEM